MNLRAFYYGIVDYITVIYYNYIVCNQKKRRKNASVQVFNERAL